MKELLILLFLTFFSIQGCVSGLALKIDPDMKVNDVQMYVRPISGNSVDNRVGFGMEVGHLAKLSKDGVTYATFGNPCGLAAAATSGPTDFSGFLGFCGNLLGLRYGVGYNTGTDRLDFGVGLSLFSGAIDYVTNPSPKPMQ